MDLGDQLGQQLPLWSPGLLGVCKRRRYGFKQELAAKWGKDAGGIYTLCKKVFSLLPLAALVQQKTLIMHGGERRAGGRGRAVCITTRQSAAAQQHACESVHTALHQTQLLARAPPVEGPGWPAWMVPGRCHAAAVTAAPCVNVDLLGSAGLFRAVFSPADSNGAHSGGAGAAAGGGAAGGGKGRKAAGGKRKRTSGASQAPAPPPGDPVLGTLSMLRAASKGGLDPDGARVARGGWGHLVLGAVL